MPKLGWHHDDDVGVGAVYLGAYAPPETVEGA